MTREQILGLIDEMDAAFNRHDAAAIAACYAENAPLHDQAAPSPVVGREAVREYIAGYMHAFPDLRWERVSAEVDGQTAVEEWHVSGTHTGDMPGLRATGRRIEIDGCSVFQIGDDGLVREERNYWDAMAMLRQLGAVTEPAAAR
jgi:steroid delta-isomerase-like uncharacterized protein